MKVATWNVERLKHKRELSQITEICNQIKADILVLTETDMRLELKYKTCVQTLSLTDTSLYQSTERRVSLFTNYDLVQKRETFDDATAVCVELITERGALVVYGVVIGIFGNRHQNFKRDLQRIIADIDRLTAEGKPVCVLGDYNCSFADNYYFTKDGRAALCAMVSQNNLELLTHNQRECIDHIAISRNFTKGLTASVHEWNRDKKLSDHKGVCVELKQ